MSRRPLFLLVFCCLALLAFSAPAHARYYVGAAYLSTDSEFETAVDNFDADDSSFKFFAGRTFFKFLAIEASYADVGTHQDTVGPNSIDVDLEAYGLAARGLLPVGKRFHAFAKAGYSNVSADGEIDAAGLVTDFDEDDWELVLGLGLEVDFGKHLALRAEWEEYDVDSDLNSLSVGALIRF